MVTYIICIIGNMKLGCGGRGGGGGGGQLNLEGWTVKCITKIVAYEVRNMLQLSVLEWHTCHFKCFQATEVQYDDSNFKRSCRLHFRLRDFM